MATGIAVKMVKCHSALHGLVYESFAGTGTTLIACEQTNRICYGMEIDEHYCTVILDRWEKFTNKKAVKLE
jgi:DNA modification methylase